MELENRRADAVKSQALLPQKNKRAPRAITTRGTQGTSFNRLKLYEAHPQAGAARRAAASALLTNDVLPFFLPEKTKYKPP